MKDRDGAFDYARDTLGEAVGEFVSAMAKAEAHLSLIDNGKGLTDEVSLDLMIAQDGYTKMFGHLLSCAITAGKNEELDAIAVKREEWKKKGLLK